MHEAAIVTNLFFFNIFVTQNSILTSNPEKNNTLITFVILYK